MRHPAAGESDYADARRLRALYPSRPSAPVPSSSQVAGSGVGDGAPGPPLTFCAPRRKYCSRPAVPPEKLVVNTSVAFPGSPARLKPEMVASEKPLPGFNGNNVVAPLVLNIVTPLTAIANEFSR